MRTILSLLLTLSSAIANPEWKESLTSEKPGTHPNISPCKLEYSLSWKGMLDAGSLEIDFAPPAIKKPGSFVITSTASSHGAAAALFPYHHGYWSEIHPTTLLSNFFHSTETSSEKVENINRYTPSNVTVKETTTSLDEKISSGLSFTFAHGSARDIFSAMLHLRSQKLDIGETHTMLLLPFKSSYLATVKVEAIEKHLDQEAIRLSLAMRKIDTTTNELAPYKKLKRPATLWLSNDTDRVLLEARASVYIGDVRAVLKKHQKHP
jgi:hypothetical protein